MIIVKYDKVYVEASYTHFYVMFFLLHLLYTYYTGKLHAVWYGQLTKVEYGYNSHTVNAIITAGDSVMHQLTCLYHRKGFYLPG